MKANKKITDEWMDKEEDQKAPKAIVKEGPFKKKVITTTDVAKPEYPQRKEKEAEKEKTKEKQATLAQPAKEIVIVKENDQYATNQLIRQKNHRRVHHGARNQGQAIQGRGQGIRPQN